jgi:hypothetical protein
MMPFLVCIVLTQSLSDALATALPADDGLVSFWDFQETSGAYVAKLGRERAVLEEQSFNGIERTWSSDNEVKRVRETPPGEPFGELSASLSTNQMLRVRNTYANAPLLNITGDNATLTLVAWVKPSEALDNTSRGYDFGHFAGIWSEPISVRTYVMFCPASSRGREPNGTSTGGHLDVEISRTGATMQPYCRWSVSYALGASPINHTTWHMLAMTFDGSSIRAFVNGSLDVRPPRRLPVTPTFPYCNETWQNPAPISTWTANTKGSWGPGGAAGSLNRTDFTVGGQWSEPCVDGVKCNGIGHPWSGLVGGLAVYDRALSATELLTIAQHTGMTPLTSPLHEGAGGAAAHGCTDGGSGGCGPPVGTKWDTWSMRASTYAYCYAGCVVDWLMDNTDELNLPLYAGVVGVDHYWTHQGVPCRDGEPREFSLQDELAQRWKAKFPELRMLQYRILSAVPSDMVVRNKILSDEDSVVRWRHEAGAASPGNGSVCYNYQSGCFNDPTRINSPANKCAFAIRAAAYNWSNPTLGDWYLEKVVKPAMIHGDGIWLDGIGPDNGAYMCAGVCCGFGAANSPLNDAEIDAHCAGQRAATTKAQQWLIANGGWEAQKCFDYLSKETGPNLLDAAGLVLPTAEDTPAHCAQHLMDVASWGANHSNYNHVVAYGGRTGGRTGYNDSTVAGTVAAFLLMRGDHWLFSIGPNGGKKPTTPNTSHANITGSLTPATAKVLLSDFGKAKGAVSPVAGKQYVFAREFERATVTLDCNTWTPTFDEHEG